ncbi:hypothetical protein A0H81_10102 [Grifola frondosa]|uniref:Uncharacterized protein n=1 Tax=Grifola frondosa TaxID=5627 RepID=A0A1C7LZZ1_GRIFR|nr:hypothetical protein A0H81_10102 [Grifola frondosa]
MAYFFRDLELTSLNMFSPSPPRCSLSLRGSRSHQLQWTTSTSAHPRSTPAFDDIPLWSAHASAEPSHWDDDDDDDDDATLHDHDLSSELDLGCDSDSDSVSDCEPEHEEECVVKAKCDPDDREESKCKPDVRTTWQPAYSPIALDTSCLAALDAQLLRFPLDAFADLCYRRAVHDARPQAYTLRVASPLAFSSSPDSSDAESRWDSESESDSDSEADSDVDPHARKYVSLTRDAFSQPSVASADSDTIKHVALPPVRSPYSLKAEVELARLFGRAPPDPSESVHFFPTPAPPSTPRPRLNISTRSASFARGLAGLLSPSR